MCFWLIIESSSRRLDSSFTKSWVREFKKLARFTRHYNCTFNLLKTDSLRTKNTYISFKKCLLFRKIQYFFLNKKRVKRTFKRQGSSNDWKRNIFMDDLVSAPGAVLQYRAFFIFAFSSCSVNIQNYVLLSILIIIIKYIFINRKLRKLIY